MSKITIIKRSLLAASISLLSACGSPQKMVQLEDARDFYNTVSRDPVVARNAGLELDDAKKSLDKAHKYWEDGADKNVVEHYAYMTDQQLAVAQYRAALIENDIEISNLSQKHEQALLAADESEALDSKIVANLENNEVRVMAIKASKLERQISELQAEQTDRGLVLTLGYQLFDGDSTSLRTEAVDKVGKVAGFMNEYPEQRVLIEGHTDISGDDSYNQELSARRAEAVKVALVLQGVKAERVVTRGLGESAPIIEGAGPVAALENRRVEIIFAKANKIQETQQLSFYSPQ